MPSDSSSRAVLFDLDGTLVETEALKGESYSRAAVELRPDAVRAEDVRAAFRQLAGRSREEVATALLQRFGLEGPARSRMSATGAATPVQVFLDIRLRIFDSMLADAALIRRQAYPAAIALLRELSARGVPTAIVTMSYRSQVDEVLGALGLRDVAGAVITRDEVDRPKPDPAIYLLAARRVDVPPGRCVVIEDSLPGVQSALAAGTTCVAVPTEVTREAIEAALRTRVLPASLVVVNDPARLAPAVMALLG